MAKNIEFCKKSQKKLQIFKKSLKKVLTLILMCGILTMQSPKRGCNTRIAFVIGDPTKRML